MLQTSYNKIGGLTLDEKVGESKNRKHNRTTKLKFEVIAPPRYMCMCEHNDPYRSPRESCSWPVSLKEIYPYRSET